MALLVVLTLLALAARSRGDVINGNFESLPAGTGWVSDAPATWLTDGKLDFPAEGGNPTGYARIQSPFNKSIPVPHLPLEGSFRQDIVCDVDSPALCTLSLQYKLDGLHPAAASGRVRIRINGVIRYVSPASMKIPWTEVSLQVPCDGLSPLTVELCLQVDAGHNGWIATFDNVRLSFEKLIPEVTTLGMSRRGEFLLRVQGREGRAYVVQSTEDLVRWRPVTTGKIVNGSFDFSDVIGSQRFYQVVEASNEWARIIDVSPPAASPGMTVRVRVDRPLFDERTPVVALVGKVPAHVRWLGVSDQVEIQVPNIDPGSTHITFEKEEFDPAGRAPFNVLSARSRQLVIDGTGGESRLLSNTPRGGEGLSAAEPDQIRLAFDVLNADRGLIYAGSILHPAAGRLEVVDDNENGEPLFHASANRELGVFALTIPNLSEPFIIRFYEASSELDLTTEKGLSARRYLNEISVKP